MFEFGASSSRSIRPTEGFNCRQEESACEENKMGWTDSERASLVSAPARREGKKTVRNLKNSPISRSIAASSETGRWRAPVRKDLFAALTFATALASQASAEELTGTLAKVKELGYITIGHREASLPFSYIDDKQRPIGFAMDICAKIVDAVKRELKLDKLEVRYQLVTASSRIPLLANGTIDLECGNTTNNAERQKQVSYTNTHFLTASRFLSKVDSNIRSIGDLKGKTIVSPAGSTNIKQALDFNTRLNLGMTIVPAQDQGEAFLMVETGRAVAFVQDDVILAGLIAISKDPKAYVISEDAFSKPEPYGIMLRKDDVAFKRVADAATAALYKSPEGAALYAKWFTQAIPPKGVNLNLPMSPAIKRAFENPTDSPDPASY
jgi:glutamate/aspartate transport system substrate-binding protein